MSSVGHAILASELLYPDSFDPQLLGALGAGSLVGLGFYIWYLWSLARLFPALGLRAGHGWIPVWNDWQLIQRGGLPGWTSLLGLVPGLSLVKLIIVTIAVHRINLEHGQSSGMTVLGFFIRPLWATILGSRLRTGLPGGSRPVASRGLVEYGADGHAYPLLPQPPAGDAGAVNAAAVDRLFAPIGDHGDGFELPRPPASRQDAAPAPLGHTNGLPAGSFSFNAPVPPGGAPQPSGQQPSGPQPAPRVAAPAPQFQSPVAPASPVAPVNPVAPTSAAPFQAPAAAAEPTPNPWGFGRTTEDNFQRLANEAQASGAAPFRGVDARPFSWPEPQIPVPGDEPLVPPLPAPGSVQPAPIPAPPLPPVPAPPVTTPAPPVPAPAPPAVSAPPAGQPVPADVPKPAPNPAAAPNLPDPTAAIPVPAVQPAVPAQMAPADVAQHGGFDDDELDNTLIVSRGTKWALVLVDGTELELVGDDIVIGRKPVPLGASGVLVVPDTTRTLSKSHARLRRSETGWEIEDLNSTNGVYLLGEQGETVVVPGTPMALGERFIIGTLEVQLRQLGGV